MTKEATGSSFAPELLGGVPEAFVQTALLAGGIGLWEWQVVADRMALSPYLETLFGYPSGGFDGTKATFLARLKPIDKPRFELALANAIERGEEVDTEFQIFDVHGVNRCFVAKARVMSDSTGAAVRFVGTMQELPAATVARATVVVDAVDAALAEAGDLIIPLRDGLVSREHFARELGMVASGAAPARASADEITLFKSVGNAVQDVVVARRAVDRARERGLGTEIDLN